MSPKAAGGAELAREPARLKPGAPRGPSLARRAWDQFGTLAVAVLLALGIRAFVIEPYRIPSGSMLPTLLIGDHLFVNKFAYGPKIPFTDYRLPGWRKPQRGDVVVFTVARDRVGRIYPADLRPDLDTDRFVKRIVGLPGDTIEVRGGTVFVNGQRVPWELTQETFKDENGRVLRVGREDLEGRPHAILHDPSVAGPEKERITLEPDRYFMMGDNRDYSNDSRIWGTVHGPDIKGPAFVLYWSWDWNGGWASLLNPMTWWDLFTHRMRWDRIGHSIQ
ncbi:MAG TPA: signal peptidase I [Myxococcota bacterium]|nr:signal peptidase I [Myxococcota bacterium]